MSEFVNVIVRCRPLNERELESDVDVVVTMDTAEHQVTLRQSANVVSSPHKVFTFDHVFSTMASNEQIYNDIVSPLVRSVMNGYNGCIFAYGQTSCGKTFSMQGAPSIPSQRGIMSRTFEQIFEYIQNADITYCTVKASYLEIYNEEIRDLLHKQNRHKLVVKEHPEKGIYVRDLTSVDVLCIEDIEEVLEVGSWNRVCGSTEQNPDSSRSHCIFTIEYELCLTSESDEHFRSGRINLVDLAGSERQRYSRSHGERFKEATKINLSLSALGNVISALVNEKSKHIPYRASKLTRLLQDSLGGNSRTLMIACISPGENNESETLSTLRYANRAKNIKNRPRINEDPKETLIRQYKKEIKTLRKLLSNQMRLSKENNPINNSTLVYSSHNEAIQSEKSPIPKRSAVVISKQEQLSYEQKIGALRHKCESEHLSKARLEKALKSIKGEYDNYRLKHEYKVQKIQTHYKTKLKQLQKEHSFREEQNITSDESAYISAATSENTTENLSLSDSLSDKQDKSTLLSPLRENSHLWSYQWLRCYCTDKTSKQNMTFGAHSPSEEFNTNFNCICIEQIKQNKDTEKASQTCEICSKRTLYAMRYGCQTSITQSVVTSQPDDSMKQQSQLADLNDEYDWSGLCCLLPFVSFFGEKIAYKHV